MAVKKIQSPYFDLNQKFISYKMKETVLLTFCMSQFFELGKIQALKFFYGEKNPASVQKLGLLEYCHAKLWLDRMMVRGQNNDFSERNGCMTLLSSFFGHWILWELIPKFSVSENPKKRQKWKKNCHGTIIRLTANSSHQDLIWMCYMALCIGYILLNKEMHSLAPPKNPLGISF